MDIPLQALGKATAELDSLYAITILPYIVCHFLDSAKVAITTTAYNCINPLMRADILARAQIQTWKIPFKTKY